jgi:hypothetical protein
MREETMKAIIVTLATTIIGAGAAYAASETVTMNAIDATGVGKKTKRQDVRFWPKADICGSIPDLSLARRTDYRGR